MAAELPYRESVVRWVDPADLGHLVREPIQDGLDYLRRIADGSLPDAPAIVATGSRLVEVEPGRALVHFVPRPVHCNALRQVHGGVISTLLDSAIGYAVVSTLSPGQGFSTLQIHVNFLRGLAPGSEAAVVEGRLLRRGRRVLVAEASLHDAEGRLCANASATCLPA